MTAHACQLCGAAVLDAPVCSGCARRLELALGDVPALVSDLEVVLAKLTVYADQPQRVTGSREEVVPFQVPAGAARQHLHVVLQSWVRIVHEEHPHPFPLPRDRVSAFAAWLLHYVEWVRHQEWAAEAIDNILGVVADVRRVLDAPPNRATIHVGPCPEVDCQGQVMAYIPRDPTAGAQVGCSADPLHTWDSTQLLRLSKKFARRREPMTIKPHLMHYEAGPCLGCGGFHIAYRRNADALAIEGLIQAHIATCEPLAALHVEAG